MIKHSSNSIHLSIIIAVYQRKNELKELLDSLSIQTDKDFEVIIVDDGSPEPLKEFIINYKIHFNALSYYYKENSGPGLSRNYACSKASGNYFLFIDSDCIVPQDYIKNIKENLSLHYVDAFGGSDSAHSSFSALQKAISYSMTSFLTTGGIRGSKNSVDKFQPRSFNMGISKEAFEKVHGFSKMRVGEDPDLTLNLWENGFTTSFFNNCAVYHKRRTNFQKFAHQVYLFGIARPILNNKHPKYKKITFWFPSIFLLFSLFALSCAFIAFFNKPFYFIPILLLFFYFILIFIGSSLKNKSLKIGILSVISSNIQFIAYGSGFLISYFKIFILKISPEKAFPSHFS